MLTEEIKIDITEVKERKSRDSIKRLIDEINLPFKELFNFWSHFEEEENEITNNAIVISDLHSLINHCQKINKDLWSYKVKKNTPYFISIIRNKRDERVADLIDNILKISDNRLSVIKATQHFTDSKDQKELLTELHRIIERNFKSDAIKKANYNKAKESFIVEFNDGEYGEISLNDLEIQDLKDHLLLESTQISDQGNAIEIFTKDGEIFDIDSMVLKSMITKEVRNKIDKDTKLTAQTVGSQIRSVRNKDNLTQKELAEKTGIDQAIISKIETGKHLPRFDTLERIAQGLGITVTSLLDI